MPTLLITRNEAAQLSGASAATVNKAIEQRVVAIKSVGSASLVDARDVGALTLFAGLRFGLPVIEKRRLARWLRNAPLGDETALGTGVIVRKTPELEEAMEDALRYARLKERFFETSLDRQGGEPVIRGTRVPIRGLARQIEAGEGLAVLREQYEGMDEDAFEFAVQWARANPRRGRPTREAASNGFGEPASRQAHIARRRRELAHG
ncbi:DUF433 domain-containing protein [Capillimicrobium parvum]|uniref:DUF433 domain-containing protein n=1 Tax=Capillimicrobium parvum TaxID=2884022 RepID=A0A9E6XVR0_9ACTN|nr:DUF433 domain-containing protein [Capillimicrobium parvum]UGS35345.1 hypothetical protein DSM104329_01732 [Capillimicrobium parvum]